MKFLALLTFAAALVASPAARAETPAVIATIKPIHALVAAVMGDLGTPTLIVRGAASPHTYSLKPSDAGAIEAADVVFWIGPDMEVFIKDALGTLAPDARIVALGPSPGIELLPLREGGAFEAHEDEDEHGHEDEGQAPEEIDMHMFLDPVNAQAMVKVIAATLGAADPEHDAVYAANAAAEIAALAALTAEVQAMLDPVKDKPFIVFHDAFQYFERRFGLNLAGSITVSPEVMPGAERVAAIRDRLRTLSASCVFAEPQFDAGLVDVLVEGSGARAGVLDPEGASIPEGRGAYAALLRNLATGLVACLGPSSAAP